MTTSKLIFRPVETSLPAVPFRELRINPMITSTLSSSYKDWLVTSQNEGQQVKFAAGGIPGRV